MHNRNILFRYIPIKSAYLYHRRWPIYLSLMKTYKISNWTFWLIQYIKISVLFIFFCLSLSSLPLSALFTTKLFTFSLLSRRRRGLVSRCSTHRSRIISYSKLNRILLTRARAYEGKRGEKGAIDRDIRMYRITRGLSSVEDQRVAEAAR